MGGENNQQQTSDWSWQEIMKIGIPGLLSIATLIVTGLIHNSQTAIQNTVDSNQRTLASQLAFQSALREEFYKRRLNVYESACKELAAVEAALDNAGTTTENETAAFDLIAKFDQLNKGNTLYWSDGLRGNLNDFWSLGVEKLREQKWDDATVNDKINQTVAAAHERMKEDLNVADLATIRNSTK